jgi:hypothetical protein
MGYKQGENEKGYGKAPPSLVLAVVVQRVSQRKCSSKLSTDTKLRLISCALIQGGS